MNKMSSFNMHHRGKKREKGDTRKLAAHLAPLEEQEKPTAVQQIGGDLSSTIEGADRNHGAIVVDNDNLKLPKDIMEENGQKRFLGMEPVVLVVLIVMLSFIVFITWQITLMPAR